MKSLLLIFVIVFFGFKCHPQHNITVYALPGLGADQRLFDSLQLPKNYTLKVINYGTPLRNQTMASFAAQQIQFIDTTQKFVLLGSSLGGMMVTELAHVLHPQHTIIISSAKGRNDLPLRYKVQSLIPVYKLFPAFSFKWGSLIMQPIVEPDRKKYKKVFVSMIKAKPPLYMKRSVGLIMSWKRKHVSVPIVHIHGNSDHTLPIKSIKNIDYLIDQGSHLITLTKPEEITAILFEILK